MKTTTNTGKPIGSRAQIGCPSDIPAVVLNSQGDTPSAAEGSSHKCGHQQAGSQHSLLSSNRSDLYSGELHSFSSLHKTLNSRYAGHTIGSAVPQASEIVPQWASGVDCVGNETRRDQQASELPQKQPRDATNGTGSIGDGRRTSAEVARNFWASIPPMATAAGGSISHLPDFSQATSPGAQAHPVHPYMMGPSNFGEDPAHPVQVLHGNEFCKNHSMKDSKHSMVRIAFLYPRH